MLTVKAIGTYAEGENTYYYYYQVVAIFSYMSACSIIQHTRNTPLSLQNTFRSFVQAPKDQCNYQGDKTHSKSCME